jgi:hypothetical protein
MMSFYEDDMNMSVDKPQKSEIEYYLSNLSVSLKTGDPNDAIRALQGLYDSGFRLHAPESSDPVVHSKACGPKPRFGTYIPPWKRGENPVDTKVVDAKANVTEADTKVVDAKAEVVDAKANVTEADTKVVDAKAEVVDAKAEVVDAKAEVVDQQQVSKRMKKLTKKLAECMRLVDETGEPLKDLNADQIIKAQSIKQVQDAISLLEQEEAIARNKQNARKELELQRIEAQKIQEELDTLDTRISTKSKRNDSKSKKSNARKQSKSRKK